MASASSGESFRVLQQLAQRQPIHVFHQQIMESARLAEIINRHDVRMTQSRQRAGFALETLGKLGVRNAAVATAGENFQRDQTIQLRLARFVNRAHAAASEAFDDFELGEVRGEFGHGGVGGAGGFCKTVPSGPTSPVSASPALSMHSGQMPSSAVVGTGLPQCGHLLSVAIHFPSPITKESPAQGYEQKSEIRMPILETKSRLVSDSQVHSHCELRNPDFILPIQAQIRLPGTANLYPFCPYAGETPRSGHRQTVGLESLTSSPHSWFLADGCDEIHSASRLEAQANA